MTIYGSSGRKAKYFHLLLSEVLCNLDVEAVLGLDLDDLLGDALAGLLKQGFSGKFSKTGEAVKVKNVFTGRDRTGRRTSEYVLILDWYQRRRLKRDIFVSSQSSFSRDSVPQIAVHCWSLSSSFLENIFTGISNRSGGILKESYNLNDCHSHENSTERGVEERNLESRFLPSPQGIEIINNSLLFPSFSVDALSES